MVRNSMKVENTINRDIKRVISWLVWIEKELITAVNKNKS